jgi:hypothetical protein
MYRVFFHRGAPHASVRPGQPRSGIVFCQNEEGAAAGFMAASMRKTENPRPGRGVLGASRKNGESFSYREGEYRCAEASHPLSTFARRVLIAFIEKGIRPS